MYKDLVSVIMTVYNTANYLHNPLNSILAQSYSNYEFLIINDASTDTSREYIKAFMSQNQKLNLHYFENHENLGQAASLNIGLDNAKGEYVCLIDSDDSISPNFLSLLVKKIRDSLDFVYCGFDTIQTVTGKVTPYLSNRKYLDDSNEIIRQYMNARNHFAFVGAIYRREFLDRNKIRFNQANRYGCDIEFICDLFLKRPRCGCVHESLYNYLVRQNSLSTDPQCPNIFHCVDGLERIQKKIPTRLGKLRFASTRKANMIFHVVCDLHEKGAKKRISLSMKYYYICHFVIEMLRNPKPKLKAKNVRALSFFLK